MRSHIDQSRVFQSMQHVYQNPSVPFPYSVGHGTELPFRPPPPAGPPPPHLVPHKSYQAPPLPTGPPPRLVARSYDSYKSHIPPMSEYQHWLSLQNRFIPDPWCHGTTQFGPFGSSVSYGIPPPPGAWGGQNINPGGTIPQQFILQQGFEMPQKHQAVGDREKHRDQFKFFERHSKTARFYPDRTANPIQNTKEFIKSPNSNSVATGSPEKWTSEHPQSSIDANIIQEATDSEPFFQVDDDEFS
jgi:hypothetical protein